MDSLFDDEDPTQTPDMTAAGAPGLGGTGSIMDALASTRGTIPSAAILSLLQGPTQGQRYAQAAAGGFAAMSGQPNPVTPILAQQQQQSNALAVMLQRMSAQQDLAGYRKSQIGIAQEKLADARSAREKALLKNGLEFTMSVIKDPAATPEMLARAQPQAAQLAKKLYPGVELPDTFLKRGISQEQQADLQRDIYHQIPDDLLLQKHAWLTPPELQKWKGVRLSPQLVKDLNLTTNEDLAAQDVDRQLKRAQLLEAQFPYLKLNPTLGAAALVKAEELFPGIPFEKLSPEERTRTVKWVEADKREQDLQTHLLKGQQDLAKQKELARYQHGLGMERDAAKLALKISEKGSQPIAESTAVFVNKKGETAPTHLTEREATERGYFKVTPNEFSQVNTGQQAMIILQNMKSTIEEMKKEHLFVEKGGLPGLLQQAQIKSKQLMGDPQVSRRLLTNFESQKAQMVILMRLLGEKGVRALGAFAPAMETLSPARGAPAAESMLSNIESEIRALANRARTPDMYHDIPLVFPHGQGTPLAPSGWSIREIK